MIREKPVGEKEVSTTNAHNVGCGGEDDQQ